MQRSPLCPDCNGLADQELNRRDFVRVTGAATAAASLAVLGRGGAPALSADAAAPQSDPETLVAQLYKSLNPSQRSKICFPWDHTDDRGLLRTHVSNNWNITDRNTLNVGGPFFSKDQQELIEAIFFGLYNPDWHDRIRKQLQDDAGGYGKQQTIALFGEPGTDKFEFVMTGRHLTIRCDGNTTEHVAFGGPIFYGHAAQGFNEKPDHPGNVYWHQALKANNLFQMLSGKQREVALVQNAPYEDEVPFRGPNGPFPGIPIGELSADQQEEARKVLALLVEPYRGADQSEVKKCLEAQGGFEKCALAFYRNDIDGLSADIGDDGVWDIWRIEGPSFVWHYRGKPHVHVWVSVADDPHVTLNAAG